jgi:DNA-binding IclR family transcriptional regulator
MSAQPHAPTGTQSGAKLLSVLLCFSGARPVWRVADLAAEVGLTISTTYRYVALLREVGLLESTDGSAYHLTDKVIALAEAAEGARPSIADIALPVMTVLRDEIGETVLIARRSGESAFCVERVESRQAVRLQFERGQAMALHSGSMPRLLLSAMPSAQRRAYVERIAPTLSPERRAMLTEEALDRTAQLGHSESMEEIDAGIWGCAAVVRQGHDVVAVLGTAGPAYRLEPERRGEIRRKIVAAADRISSLLGGRPGAAERLPA